MLDLFLYSWYLKYFMEAMLNSFGTENQIRKILKMHENEASFNQHYYFEIHLFYYFYQKSLLFITEEYFIV